MKIYLRKIDKQCIIKQISIKKYILRDFFNNAQDQEIVSMVGALSNQNGNVKILTATDPRLGGEIKNIINAEVDKIIQTDPSYQLSIDDILLFAYIESKKYILEIITKKDARYQVLLDLINNPQFKTRNGWDNLHLLTYSDSEESNFINDASSNSVEINENLREKGGENIILYGVPGSGKSHTIRIKYPQNEYIFEKLVFHPDYSYSDFVGQIMPIVKDEIVSYEFIPGPFTNILKKAYNNPSRKYVLVIDEINRGNAPAIFGEVFQLLDRDKDGNSNYAINNDNIAKIVYEGDTQRHIKIPSNLWIIATMNTSDQNVFTLDTAFQRRFSMQLIRNSFDKNKEEFESEEKYNEYKNFIDKKILNTDVTWQKFCKTINSIISKSNNDINSMEDKRLGVFFVKTDDLESKEKFAHKVLKYLWDDVFKFDKDKLFNKNKYHTLEEVIKGFVDEDGKSQFDIFIDDIKDMLYV
ncbi:AAA family ATPase [Campylobacter jejuni]|uniref:AAA family ATPase n=5 Tax=Campylobacter coli TaxID=195 RepID=A0A401B0U1_CAMCO|nr:AAA family ATPase [Campylobacter coli]EAH4740119.1 AAA family ATPase [Campylobacter jejuni]EAC2140311.1 AAA family ATPase [Campylobacter coli]EAH4940833.1 AAA family ATPase [Campylobacter coli]EAH4942698.1 AAA family ATPase [Campylobacter coli]EAH4949685.1 AAA family ATPase [Campylobacter coli]